MACIASMIRTFLERHRSSYVFRFRKMWQDATQKGLPLDDHSREGAKFMLATHGQSNPGSDPEQVQLPWGIAEVPGGGFLVVDRGNHRVVYWGPAASQGIVVAGGSRGTGLHQLRRKMAKLHLCKWLGVPSRLESRCWISRRYSKVLSCSRSIASIWHHGDPRF